MLLLTKLCIEKSEICLQLSPNTSTHETVHSSYSNLVRMIENVLNQEIMFLNREDELEQIVVQKCSDMMWSALKCLQHIRYIAIFEFEVSISVCTCTYMYMYIHVHVLYLCTCPVYKYMYVCTCTHVYVQYVQEQVYVCILVLF